MHNFKNEFEKRLTETFNPLFLQIDDESWQHGGGADAQSHFKIVLVSAAFEGKKLLARHREVQSLLADLISHIRALSLHTLTPQEWQAADSATNQFRSPGCHNKAKKEP